jgi:hypothetical protein
MAKRHITVALEHLAVIIDDLLSVHIEAANPKQRRELLEGVLAEHVLDLLLKSETLPVALKALDQLAAGIRRELETEWSEAHNDRP